MVGKKASRAEVEDRIEKAEEMLCAGVSPGYVERKLAEEYGITTRAVRTYIQRVYKRWKQQTAADAPHRREKVIRMAERFFAKAQLAKQYTAAANALNLLAKLSGAFAPAEQSQSNVVELLGPMPDDPTSALIYAQRAMVLALSEVVSNPSIDPERRLRWISEIGGKIGMTHAKALVQHKLGEVARQIFPGGVEDDGGQPVDSAEWTRFRRDPPGHTRQPALPGHGASSEAGQDEGVAAEGGGPLGPPGKAVH